MSETGGILVVIQKDAAPEVGKWEGRDEFDALVQAKAENGRANCTKDIGDCCLTLTVDNFRKGDRAYNSKAAIWGECTNSDCPNPDLVIDTAFEAVQPGETVLRGSRSRSSNIPNF